MSTVKTVKVVGTEKAGRAEIATFSAIAAAKGTGITYELRYRSDGKRGFRVVAIIPEGYTPTVR